jgi:hypothetical protein
MKRPRMSERKMKRLKGHRKAQRLRKCEAGCKAAVSKCACQRVGGDRPADSAPMLLCYTAFRCTRTRSLYNIFSTSLSRRTSEPQDAVLVAGGLCCRRALPATESTEAFAAVALARRSGLFLATACSPSESGQSAWPAPFLGFVCASAL